MKNAAYNKYVHMNIVQLVSFMKFKQILENITFKFE